MTALCRFPALLSAALLVSTALAGTVLAQGATTTAPAEVKPDTVLARVDGQPITQAELDIAAEDLGDRVPRVAEAQKREYLLGYLIDLKTGAKAAAAAKAAEGPDFAQRLDYQRNKLLLDAYLSDAGKDAVTPEASKKLYDETVKDLKPEQEVRARHILVEDEATAKKVAERLKAGEDFAKLAAELSKDPGSGKDGGDLGFFSKDRMVPEFAETAFNLEPGQVSEPVKTQFGWHVIKLEEKRTKPVPAYADVKEQIDAFLARKAQQDLILALRGKAKIERLDQPKPEAQPAPAAPAEKK